MDFEYNIAKDAACSISERKECIGLIDQLCEYSEKARREGLLALEDELSAIKNPLLKKGLALAIEGTDPNVLQTILLNYIKFGNLKGRELLEQCIVAQGIMSIQSGDNIWLLREKLKALLGGIGIKDSKDENIQRELENLFAKEDEERFARFLDKIKKKKPYSINTQILDSFFPSLDELQISRLLVDVDVDTLAIALSGASGDVILKIMKMYPVSWSLHLLDKIEEAKIICEEDKIICQKKIENIYIKLKEIKDL